jgi:hypothetical protein
MNAGDATAEQQNARSGTASPTAAVMSDLVLTASKCSDLQATPAKIRASFCMDQWLCPTRAIKLSHGDEEGLALPMWELAGIGWQFNVPGRGRKNWLRSYQPTVCGW